MDMSVTMQKLEKDMHQIVKMCPLRGGLQWAKDGHSLLK